MYTVYVPCTASFLTRIYFSYSYIFIFTLRSNFDRKSHYITANSKYSPNEIKAASVFFSRFVCTASNGRLLLFVLKCSAEYLLNISAKSSRISQSHLLLMQPYLVLRSMCAVHQRTDLHISVFLSLFLSTFLSKCIDKRIMLIFCIEFRSVAWLFLSVIILFPPYY